MILVGMITRFSRALQADGGVSQHATVMLDHECRRDEMVQVERADHRIVIGRILQVERQRERREVHNMMGRTVGVTSGPTRYEALVEFEESVTPDLQVYARSRKELDAQEEALDTIMKVPPLTMPADPERRAMAERAMEKLP